MKQIAIRQLYHEDKLLKVYETRTLELEAELAWALTERWGMVAGIPDGEDTAGRTKLALLSPREVVNRACDTAGLFYKEVDRRGWVKSNPDVSELLGKDKGR